MSKDSESKTHPYKDTGRPRALWGSDVPIATILPFAGIFEADLGDDWMMCLGQSLRTDDYKDLYKVIGTAWGVGDNPPNTFNLPDLRGAFLRGVAHGLDTDPDRDARFAIKGGNSGDKIGSFQRDQLQGHSHPAATTPGSGQHSHPVNISRGWMSGSNGTHDVDGGGDKWNSDPNLGSISASIDPSTGGHSHPITVSGPIDLDATKSVRTGLESRPYNAYVHWIIRVNQ